MLRLKVINHKVILVDLFPTIKFKEFRFPLGGGLWLAAGMEVGWRRFEKFRTTPPPQL